jgi:CHAT domain-containing protein/tetratricopeptide (TPR) repeat protein
LAPCLIVVAVCLPAGAALAEPPRPVPARERREQLQERDRLRAEAERLQQQDKLAEAVTAARKALAIERRAFGDVHEDVAGSLERLTELYRQQEDFDAARAASKELLSLWVKLYGAKDWRVDDARWIQADVEHTARLTPAQRRQLAEAERLARQARGHLDKGRFREGLGPAQQALEIRRQVLGERHFRCGLSLNVLAQLYSSLAEYARAEPLYIQALDIYKQALGEKHPFYAAGLNNLGTLYAARAQYARAERLYSQALEIQREARGKKSAEYATSLINLAELYRANGDYRAAKPLLEQGVVTLRDALGEQSSLYVNSLNRLALLHHAMGHPGRAQELLSHAVETARQRLGRRHPLYAVCLSNLAMLHVYAGAYSAAQPLYQEALGIYEQAKVEDQPEYAACLNNLALLYQEMGEYARADRLYQRALQIYRPLPGQHQVDYAQILSNRAQLYYHTGDYDQAELLFGQALRIRLRVLGKEHPDYAQGLNNLAGLYRARGTREDNTEAESLYSQALRITEKALGKEHPDYAAILDNLASVSASLGKHARALPLRQQALEIRRRVLGRHHPKYATSLNNLALMYQSTGDYARAEPLLCEALRVIQQGQGERHPTCATVRSNLAKLHWSEAVEILRPVPRPQPLPNLTAVYAAADYLGRAECLLRQALETSRANLELAAAAQSQHQQLAMLRDLRCRLDDYLSLASDVQQPVADQYQEVLAWKGAVARRQRRQRLARKESRLAADFAELDRVSCRLAALALGAGDPKDTQRRRRIQALSEQKERLEGELARKSTAFRHEKDLPHLGPAQLQAALPADAVLLDFLEYRHVWPSLSRKGGLKGERRLVAFVVRPDALVRVDLGPLKPLREVLKRWREALQRRFVTEGDARLAQEVRRLLWRPLEPHLRGARVVLVSPDGALASVPFAALPGGKKGSYLLEEVALAVVPVPQLLPELLSGGPRDRKGEPSLLVVGDVRYDGADGRAAGAESRTTQQTGPGRTLMRWAPLESTAAEVGAINNVFQRRFRKGTVTDLREDEATEAAVRKEASAHRYLHFATHGFFAPRELRSALADASRGGRPGADDLFGRRGMAGVHPGLLSGLVLAGANRPADAEKDDGILTALEVEALDLSGVELAVLSACETGLGEEAGGEGLLGLQRAFQLAGAHSVVASLWQVDDRATRELMVRFYENLWKRKMSKVEALRQAQLWMLKEGIGRGMVDIRVPEDRLPKEDGRLAPYFWAAFSLSGDWR